jgi:hypothetical protein
VVPFEFVNRPLTGMDRMRSSSPFLFLFGVLAVLAPPAAAQGTFEGVITMTLNADEKPMSATAWVKGDKAKYQMASGGEMSDMIMDGSGRMLMLVPKQKQYMVIDMSGMNAQTDKVFTAMTYSRTGKSETIAGMSCDYWKTVQAKKVTGESCMTSSLGWVGVDLTGKGTLSKEALAEFRRSFPKGAFPLKVIDAETGKAMLVVTKVEKKAVPDDTFRPPAGFTEIKVPGAPAGKAK